MTDLINHPPHYRKGGIEVIDVIEGFDLNYRLGNVIKYVLRHGYKGNPESDLRKASWYLDREIGCYGGKPQSANPAGLCYLATSYTRRPSRKKAFAEAAALCARLRNEKQIIAFSPVAHGHPMSEHGEVDPADHDWWLEFHQPFMFAAMALLVANDEGWRESKGIAAEIEYFKSYGKPIYDLDPVTLETTKRL